MTKLHDESKTIVVSEYGYERRALRDKFIIMLMGDVYSDAAQNIIEDVHILSMSNVIDREIKLIISSPGGELDDGLAIIDAIVYAQEKNIRVVGDVFGMAASMASIILEYCDERVLSKHGWLMIHGVTSFTIADIKDTKAQLVFTQGAMEQFAVQYANRNTSSNEKYHTVEYWREKFEEKTPMFLNAEQALEMGLVDKVR